MPWDALTVIVPPRVPPLGFDPSVTVTAFVAADTVFPTASCTATWTAGGIGWAPAALVGCTVKAGFVAAEGGCWSGPVAFSQPRRPAPRASGRVLRTRRGLMACIGLFRATLARSTPNLAKPS